MAKDINDKLNEKRVISAIAQNRWTVELTENFFQLFEGSEWVDEDILAKRQEVSRLTDFTEDILDEFVTEEGYDTELIQSLETEQQNNLASTLNSNTNEALQYSRQLIQRIEGQHDVVDMLPDIIDDTLEPSDTGVPTPEIDYGTFAQHLEQNIDYSQLEADIDTNELAALVAADLNIDETHIASELDVDERAIASYIDETQIAAGIDEQEIAENIEVNTRFNGTVNIDQETLEAAIENADIEIEGGDVDYNRIQRMLDNTLDIDVVGVEDETDYQRIEQIVAEYCGRRDDTYGRGFANIFDDEEKSRRGFIRDGVLGGILALSGLGALASTLDYSNGDAPAATNNSSRFDSGDDMDDQMPEIQNYEINESGVSDVLENYDDNDLRRLGVYEHVKGDSDVEVVGAEVTYNPSKNPTDSQIRWEFEIDGQNVWGDYFDTQDDYAEDFAEVTE